MKINLAAVCLRSCLSLGLLRRLLPFGRRQRLFVMHDNALCEQKPEELKDLEKGSGGWVKVLLRVLWFNFM